MTHEEEHDGARIVEFVHGVEIWDAVDVANIYDSEVLDALSNFVEDLVLAHAIWIVVATKADHDEALVFGEDGLIDMPAGVEVW